MSAVGKAPPVRSMSTSCSQMDVKPDIVVLDEASQTTEPRTAKPKTNLYPRLKQRISHELNLEIADVKSAISSTAAQLKTVKEEVATMTGELYICDDVPLVKISTKLIREHHHFFTQLPSSCFSENHHLSSPMTNSISSL